MRRQLTRRADVWLNPVGNGRGGGDRHGTCMRFVGAWRWTLISVEDAPPEGFTKVCAAFREPWL